MRHERELEPRLAHHVVRGRRQRRSRRAAQHEPVGAALEQEGEVRAAAVADPARVDRPAAEAVLVEERLEPVEDQERRALEPSASCAVWTMSIAAMLRPMRRRLYLMRHAARLVRGRARPGGRPPDGARARAGRGGARGARRRRLRPGRDELPAADGRDGGGRRARPRAGGVARVRRVARRSAGRRRADRARAALRRRAARARRVGRGSSAASRSARCSTACCRPSSGCSRSEWETALAVFHGGVNRILLSHALGGGRSYFGRFEQAPACINVLDLGDDGLDRAHGELHPVRPAPPGAHDDDGGRVVGARSRGSTSCT